MKNKIAKNTKASGILGWLGATIQTSLAAIVSMGFGIHFLL
jgi:hypothetical protein